MAYLPQQEQDQEQGQQGGQQGQPAQSVQQLSTGSGATLGSGQNIQSAQTDSPTGFTNINRYLDENRTQAQKMTESISSNIEGAGQQASSSIQDATNVFNKQAEQQRVNYDPSKFVNNTQAQQPQTFWTQQSQQKPQVSDDDIKWAINDITQRHGGMNDAAANEIYNTAKQRGVTAARLEQFVPGTNNWLQQQGKTLNPAPVLYTSNKEAQRTQPIQFTQQTQQKPQVSDDDIKWAINDITQRHGGMNDAAANEIYNTAKQHGVTADKLEQFIPGANKWLQQQGKTLNNNTNNTSTGSLVSQQAQQIASDQSRFDEFLRQRDAQYKGLGSIQEDTDLYSGLLGQAQYAELLANKAITDEGRTELANMLNTGRTTAGMGSLDNMLFVDDSLRNRLQQARQNVLDRDLRGVLGTAVDTTAQTAKDVIATNNATRQAISQDLGSAINTFDSDINQKLSDTRLNVEQTMNNIRNKLNNNQPLSNEEMRILNLNGDQYKQLQELSQDFTSTADQFRNDWSNPYEYNKFNAYMISGGDVVNEQRRAAMRDLSGYNTNIDSLYSYEDPNLYLNEQNVASQDDWARQEALSKLSGQSLNTLYNRDAAGTYMDQVRGDFDVQSINDRLQTYLDNLSAYDENIRTLIEENRDGLENLQQSLLLDPMGDAARDMGYPEEIIKFVQDGMGFAQDVGSSINQASDWVGDRISNVGKEIKNVFKKAKFW